VVYGEQRASGEQAESGDVDGKSTDNEDAYWTAATVPTAP
jgi:hypothetical protein